MCHQEEPAREEEEEVMMRSLFENMLARGHSEKKVMIKRIRDKLSIFTAGEGIA